MWSALHASPLALSALLVATLAIAACSPADGAGEASGDGDGDCGARKEPLVGSCVFNWSASCREYRGGIARAAAESDCLGQERPGTFSESSCGDFHGRGGCVLSLLGGTAVLYEAETGSSCEEREGCYFNDHVCTEREPNAALLGSCTGGESCWEVRGGDRPRDDWRTECTERGNAWVWSDEGCAYRAGGACATGESGATVLDFTTHGSDPGESEFWCHARSCSQFVRP